MRRLVCVLAAFLAAGAVSAQVSIDPADVFYAEAQAWELKGLVSALPQVRPYPANVIRAILAEVIARATDSEHGDAIPRYERDLETAKSEYERIFSRPWHASLEAGGVVKAKQLDGENDSTICARGEVTFYGDLCFSSIVSIGYKLGLYGQSAAWSDFLPQYLPPDRDSIQDAADFGPIEAYQDFDSGVAIGTPTIYATAGLSRVGYGPFLRDGLALNDAAYHAAGFLFNVTRNRWSYVSLFEAIGATNNLGEDALSGNKYLAFHAAKFRPFQRFAVSFYEASVFGRRFDLTYLIPTPYIGIQGLSGNKDNIQMGLLFEYMPVQGLLLATDVFVDDLDVESLSKFKIKSKQRVAAQTGLIFTPLGSACTRVSLDYTVIMPYTYSHWEYDSERSVTITGDAWNYQNYTNCGINIGSNLQPDSDRIAFGIRFQPARRLILAFNTSFIRHQNVAECLEDDEAAAYMLAAKGTYRTDGSVYMHSVMSGDDDATVGKHVASAWEDLNFMSGSHTMLTCQAGLTAEYAFPRSGKGQLSLAAGYLFEYVHNAGVDRDIYGGGTLPYTRNSDGTYTAADDKTRTYTLEELTANKDVRQAVDDAYRAWVETLYDKVSHYITLSVKYRY